MPAGARWLTWLEQTALAQWARGSTWGYPALETGHIIGFTVLVGAAAVFDLRLLGFGRALPVAAAARHLLGWSRRSLLLVVPTGLALFAANAAETWANPAFRLKLLLLALAGANALVFHIWMQRSMATWQHQPEATPAGAKISAVLSLLLWTGVITCGRLIAYL
jgi:hypothetical protein